MKKPVILAMETREEDLQKQREAFLAGLLAMQANYELEHPKIRTIQTVQHRFVPSFYYVTESWCDRGNGN